MMVGEGFGDNDDEQRTTMHRSISMPVKPKYLVAKPLVRSPEKEQICDEDLTPNASSTDLQQRSKLRALTKLETRSEQNFTHSSRRWDDDDDVSCSNDMANAKSRNEAMRRSLGACVTAKCCSRRVVDKSGRENISYRNIPRKSWSYMRDIVTTLVRPLLRFLPKYNARILEKPPAAEPNLEDRKTEEAAELARNEQTKERVIFSL